MNDVELHKALLMVRDRAYKLALKNFENENFVLPDQGPSAYEWALREAHGGNAKAQFAVAKLLSVGLFTKQDRQRAREFCELAVKNGCPSAVTMLAGFYEEGWGDLAVSASTAISLWQTAVELGDPGAMCALAGMYIDGRSVNRDREAGIALLRRAAELDDELAQFELGKMLVDEEDPALEAEGLRWLRLAAASGNSTAHRMLSAYYRNGEHGLLVDLQLARGHQSDADKIDALFL